MISRKRFTNSTVVAVLFVALLLPPFFISTDTANAASAPEFPFPVIGDATFSNDFNDYRELNGVHHAIDIIADKGQKIVSRTEGLITFVGYPQPDWGNAVYVRADNGKSYRYLHINNDRPGTDDGRGGGYYAYGPDIQQGKRVVKGQLLGYVGDSGNAENTVSHLHFEVYDGSRAVNPYNGLLNNSYHRTSPVSVYPKATSEILPSGSFKGGASLAYGDLDGNNTDEIIVGAGPGGKLIKIFNSAGVQLSEFAPNGADFLGGVDVAAGDVNHDGADEIITGAGKGGKFVKVFNGDGQRLSEFTPNGDDFLGGVDVAVADLNNDGTEEIITGAGPGGMYVKTFAMNGTLITQFAPYGSSRNGIAVAAGDVVNDLNSEIITAPRKKGEPQVAVYAASGVRLSAFNAYDATFRGGIRLDVANIRSGTPKAEILTIPQSDGGGRVKLFAGEGTYIDHSAYFSEEWWVGSYDIAANDTNVIGSLGVNRRTSIRSVTGLQN